MGTNREHLLLGGAEEAKLLPWARGRVRALRAAGFRHITQRYEILGLLVRVTIADHDAWIEIKGGSWEYLTWPTSLEHGMGVDKNEQGEEISPLCALTLNASDKGLRRKENVDLLAGPHDWISDDHKDVLTYDHGNGFRYAISGAQNATSGAKAEIFRNGTRIKVAHEVSGCAIFKASLPQGGTAKSMVHASYEEGGGETYGDQQVVLYRVDPKEKDDAGVSRSEEFARWAVPAGPELTITQPIFFDGKGTRCITMLETVTREPVGGGVSIRLGAPRYALRGTVSRNSDGTLGAEFILSLLVSTPDQPLERVTVQRHNAADPYYYRGSLAPDFEEQENYRIDDFTTFARLNAGSSGYSRTTTTERSVQIIGLDLTPDGTELLIERIRLSESRSYAEEVERTQFQSTHYLNDKVFPVIEHFTGSSSYYNSYSSGATNSITETITINGQPLMALELASDLSEVTQVREWAHSYSEAFPPPDAPPATVTTTRTETTRRKTLSLRDIDGRWGSLAAVVGEYDQPFNGTELRPYSVRLHAQCQGQEFDRVIFAGQVLLPPLGMSLDQMRYRSIAVRRPKEFVICFSPAGAAHQHPPMSALYDRLAETGTPDRNPLLVIRRKDKTITPGPDKFTLGEEAGFRLDPVHLL
ncbi:hypothetical protein [Delftia acidovorans]|uniref:hypothetical protein n=1 Tax=Delftia acidovorans TaxID=80866 RepID=UPI003D0E16DD